jgi:hypothetical protein
MQNTWVLLALTPAGVGALLADKGYDYDAFIQAISGNPSFHREAIVIIPALAIGLCTKSVI